MGAVRRLVLFAMVAAGCYSPQPPSGAPCSPSGACPDGLVCSPVSLTCELHADDAGRADVPRIDATLDAPLDSPVDAAPSVPMLVQQEVSSAPSGDAVSVTLPVSPVAGHVLVMIGGTPQSGLDSVSGGGAVWTRAARSTAQANVEIWSGVTNGTSATVTIALAGNTSQLTIAVSEWANLAATNLVDVTSVATATATPVSAGSIATTGARELVVFGAAAFSASTWGMPTDGPWTRMTGVLAGVGQAAWYRVVMAPTTLAPSVSENGGSWDAAIVAFRATP